MRLVPVLCLVSTLSISIPVSLTARQDHHGAGGQRGAMVMSFDQALTSHHFLLFNDGGAIEVSVNDVADNIKGDEMS
jgi:hypothetical protein